MPDRIPREPRITNPQYLHMYGYNWWRKITHQPPNREYTGRCVLCHCKGILGYTLFHRGEMRRTNLLCDSCYAGPEGT